GARSRRPVDPPREGQGRPPPARPAGDVHRTPAQASGPQQGSREVKRYPPGTVLAAGALVGRERGGERRVLAVHRPRYGDWSWPKGKLVKGETLPACAVREVAEETGKDVILGQALPSLSYAVSGRTKVVRYWAARVADAESKAVVARPR